MPLNVGESVHVPSIKAGLDSSYPWAMTCGTIQSIRKGKITINLPNGDISLPIYEGLARKKLGIFIVQIGDHVTEETLLVPLKKSILQYTRLLLRDDYIRSVSVRSLAEFKYYWQREHALMSHIILIGHGSANSILFGENTWVSASEFKEALRIDGTIGEAKQVISLCCKTGGGNFGKPVSAGRMCEIFIGPSGTVHASSASQFYQSFMAYNFLHGFSSSRAYDYARVATPGVTEFNLWRKTQIHKKKSKMQVFSGR